MKKLLILITLLFSLVVTSANAIVEVSIESKVTGLYVAYFNRAGDQQGVNWWKGLAEQAGTEGKTASDVLKELSFLFSQHPSFTRAYGDMDNKTFVEAIYRNALGREGDVEGVTYWTGRLNLPDTDGNYLSRSDFVSVFVEAALTFDRNDPQYIGLDEAVLDAAQLRKDLITNKVTAALAFTHQLGILSNVTDTNNPESDPAYLASIKIVSEVTEEHATVTKILNFLDTIKDSLNPIEDILSADFFTMGIGILTAQITPEELNATMRNITVAFSKYDIDKPATVHLSAALAPPLDTEMQEGVDYQIKLYDISLDGINDFNGTVRITIPYDDSFIDPEANETQSISAVYFNPETQSYESEECIVDPVKNEATIIVNHFSSHGIVIHNKIERQGPFYVDTKREYTRFAQIVASSTYRGYVIEEKSQAATVISELINNNFEPADRALDVGFATSSTWLGLTATGNTLAGAALSGKFMDSLTKAFNGIGAFASIIQVGID